MFSRRFVLLGAVLVTLNVALWFAAPGLAIRRAIINQLFGSKMVRAEVIERNGSDWRLDRGVITQVNNTQLTLREADGRVQQIQLSSSTKVIRRGQLLSLDRLAPRWRVLVTWPANGTAQSVDVEKVPHGRGNGSAGGQAGG
jgi:hypothetical protein